MARQKGEDDRRDHASSTRGGCQTHHSRCSGGDGAPCWRGRARARICAATPRGSDQQAVQASACVLTVITNGGDVNGCWRQLADGGGCVSPKLTANPRTQQTTVRAAAAAHGAATNASPHQPSANNGAATAAAAAAPRSSSSTIVTTRWQRAVRLALEQHRRETSRGAAKSGGGDGTDAGDGHVSRAEAAQLFGGGTAGGSAPGLLQG